VRTSLRTQEHQLTINPASGLEEHHTCWSGCLSRHVSPPTHRSKTAAAATEDLSHLELWQHILLGRLSSDLALHPALHPAAEAHCFSSSPPEGLTPLARSSYPLRHRLLTLPTHPTRYNDNSVHGLGLDSGTGYSLVPASPSLSTCENRPCPVIRGSPPLAW
jgi:hypothetical protein